MKIKECGMYFSRHGSDVKITLQFSSEAEAWAAVQNIDDAAKCDEPFSLKIANLLGRVWCYSEKREDTKKAVKSLSGETNDSTAS